MTIRPRGLNLIALVLLICAPDLTANVCDDHIGDPQKFRSIDIEHADSLGWALAADKTSAVVSAIGDDDNGSRSGSGYAFNVGALSDAVKIVPHDGGIDDEFGYAVDLSDNHLIVGAPFDDDVAKDAGAAYVFRNDDGAWRLQAKLTSTKAKPKDQFGHRVAIDGDTAVVGSWGGFSGSAYVFERAGDRWHARGELRPDGLARSDAYGRAVEVSGNTIVVGAPLTTVAEADDAGAVYVFHRSGEGWQTQARLTANVPKASEQFGHSVAVGNDTVVVGAIGHFNAFLAQSFANPSGAVYVFRSRGDRWTQHAEVTPEDGEDGDAFGYSVALLDSCIAIGARNKKVHVASQGAVYLYREDNQGWRGVAKLFAEDGYPNDKYGHSVALGDGFLLVGAPSQASEAGQSTGAVYLYRAAALERR